MKLHLTVVAVFYIICAKAQVFERNAFEKKEDFVKRIFPTNATMQFNVMETNFGTKIEKIIYFSKTVAIDSAINKNEEIDCIYANILTPDTVISNKYFLHTLLIDCNNNFNAVIENAFVDRDNQKNQVLSILFCQLNRASTRLILKNYKTFHLKQTPENSFVMELVKE